MYSATILFLWKEERLLFGGYLAVFLQMAMSDVRGED